MNKLSDLINALCPKGVPMMRIADVCDRVVSGGTPNASNPDYYGGSIPWLRTQEVTFSAIDSTELSITEEGLNNSSAQWIPANCVIVAMYGATVGRVGYNTIPLTTNQACCNLIPGERINYKFLFYVLSNMYERIKGLGKGSQTNINAQIVKNLRIPVPPLAVQSEIVRILDELTELTRELEAELTSELAARKRQYECYRNELLTFKEEEE